MPAGAQDPVIDRVTYQLAGRKHTGSKQDNETGKPAPVWNHRNWRSVRSFHVCASPYRSLGGNEAGCHRNCHVEFGSEFKTRELPKLKVKIIPFSRELIPLLFRRRLKIPPRIKEEGYRKNLPMIIQSLIRPHDQRERKEHEQIQKDVPYVVVLRIPYCAFRWIRTPIPIQFGQ